MAETNTKAAKKPFFSRLVKYFKDTKSELKKVTWPSKDQIIHNTGIILAFIAIVTIILSLLDVGFAKLFQTLTNLL